MLDKTPLVHKTNKEPVFQRIGRGRGKFNNRGNFHQKQPGNKTVHINPHFKGNVPVNNNGEFAKNAYLSPTKQNNSETT